MDPRTSRIGIHALLRLGLSGRYCSCIWRLRVRQRLLEWKTASHSEQTATTSILGFFREMWSVPFLATICVVPALTGIASAEPCFSCWGDCG